MSKKILANRLSSLSLLLLFVGIIIGIFTCYFIIQFTNLLPINYGEKFKQIYTEQKRSQVWETYIDLPKGIMFNYPSSYRIDLGNYYSNVNIDGGDFRLELLGETNDIQFELLRFPVKKDASLIKFAERSQIFPWQELRQVKYTPTTINGYESVIAEFEVTKEQKEKTDFVKGAEIKVIKESVGYKGKMVYIKYNNYIYVWKIGWEGNDIREKTLDEIVQSFRLIY